MRASKHLNHCSKPLAPVPGAQKPVLCGCTAVPVAPCPLPASASMLRLALPRQGLKGMPWTSWTPAAYSGSCLAVTTVQLTGHLPRLCYCPSPCPQGTCDVDRGWDLGHGGLWQEKPCPGEPKCFVFAEPLLPLYLKSESRSPITAQLEAGPRSCFHQPTPPQNHSCVTGSKITRAWEGSEQRKRLEPGRWAMGPRDGGQHRACSWLAQIP